jgi:hypothetical protein
MEDALAQGEKRIGDIDCTETFERGAETAYRGGGNPGRLKGVKGEGRSSEANRRQTEGFIPWAESVSWGIGEVEELGSRFAKFKRLHTRSLWAAGLALFTTFLDKDHNYLVFFMLGGNMSNFQPSVLG